MLSVFGAKRDPTVIKNESNINTMGPTGTSKNPKGSQKSLDFLGKIAARAQAQAQPGRQAPVQA